MSTTENLFKDALALNTEQKTKLIDCLIQSLKQTKSDSEELWKEEVESRIDAYEQGKQKSVSLDEVLQKYK